mgnify:CR=1 FL=1|tara:strand:- start:703 stop:909 length:207 start_codon:yes stop_codon:yes gene_type:complete
MENCNWTDLVYIGDNPLKDFVSLKRVQAKTIRLNRGNYCKVKVTNEFEADSCIDSLNQLNSELTKLFK